MTQTDGCQDDLFEQQYSRLVAWCKTRLRADIADPEEVVHLAYLRSRRRRINVKPTDKRYRSYTWRTLRWALWDTLRSHQRRNRCVHVGLIESVQRPTPAPWRDAAAREALERLSKRELAVCHSSLSGIGVTESCEILSLRRGTVSVHLSRARRKLLRLLEIGQR